MAVQVKRLTSLRAVHHATQISRLHRLPDQRFLHGVNRISISVQQEAGRSFRGVSLHQLAEAVLPDIHDNINTADRGVKDRLQNKRNDAFLAGEEHVLMTLHPQILFLLFDARIQDGILECGEPIAVHGRRIKFADRRKYVDRLDKRLGNPRLRENVIKIVQMRVISAGIPGGGILQHVVERLADHKGHHNQHQFIQLLIHDLCGPDHRVLRELQRILFQCGSRDIIRQSSGHQDRKHDDSQKSDLEFVAERLPAEILQAFHAFR
ncbi:Uncharacterised protein [Actinobacillus pleuropneumoniae]|nr:Uncharacterised protein [Actinobacillus pleuropneumoniae]